MVFVCLLDRKSTTSELQSPDHLVCRLLLEKKKEINKHSLEIHNTILMHKTYQVNIVLSVEVAFLIAKHLLFNIFLFDCVFFFFNDTATTEIYTLSLHDALPI